MLNWASLKLNFFFFYLRCTYEFTGKDCSIKRSLPLFTASPTYTTPRMSGLQELKGEDAGE